MPRLLEHSIVGQSALTLRIRKDREFAGCRICGAIFQSWLNSDTDDETYANDPMIAIAANIETKEWRENHNRKHPDRVHEAFRKSGLTMTPEAAMKLAPFGLVPVDDAVTSEEVAQAMLEAPRAPTDDPEGSLRLWKSVPTKWTEY